MFVYGDSITEDIGNAKSGVVNLGIRSMGLVPDRLADTARIPQGSSGIVSIGWNDALTAEQGPSHYARLLTAKLLDIAERTNGAPFVLLPLEPLTENSPYRARISDNAVRMTNEALATAMDAARVQAAARGIPFHAEILPPHRSESGERAPDGLHYTTAGSRATFSRAEAAIERMQGGVAGQSYVAESESPAPLAARPVAHRAVPIVSVPAVPAAPSARVQAPPTQDRVSGLLASAGSVVRDISEDVGEAISHGWSRFNRAVASIGRPRSVEPTPPAAPLRILAVDDIRSTYNRAQLQEQQRDLKALGLYHGDIDGIRGRGMNQAIRDLERLPGFQADGVLHSEESRALHALARPQRHPQGRG